MPHPLKESPKPSGAIRTRSIWAKRHPFDLEWNRVPPSKRNFPYHAHSAQWELYVVISGKGTVRHKDGTTQVVAGDAFTFGPDEPHQLSNQGSEDFVIM
jgi:uncharacterized cupin superfamily protein